MTTQQDSVDVERQARELLAAQGDARFAANIMAHARDERISVTASTALDAIIAALTLPITQRDEQAKTYADGVEDAANVAEYQTKVNVQARQDRADDTLAFEFQGLGEVISTAIRRLSIEQGDQDGGER